MVRKRGQDKTLKIHIGNNTILFDYVVESNKKGNFNIMKKRIDKRTIDAYYTNLVIEKYQSISDIQAIIGLLKREMISYKYSEEEIKKLIEEFKINTAIDAARFLDFFEVVEEALRQVARVEAKYYNEIVKRVEVLIARKFSKILGVDVSTCNVEVYGSVKAILEKLAELGRVKITRSPEHERRFLYQYVVKE